MAELKKTKTLHYVFHEDRDNYDGTVRQFYCSIILLSRGCRNSSAYKSGCSVGSFIHLKANKTLLKRSALIE